METQKEVIEYMVCEQDKRTGKWFARKECDKLEDAERWLKSYAETHPRFSWGIIKKTVEYATVKTAPTKTPAEELFELLEKHCTINAFNTLYTIGFLKSLVTGLEYIPEVKSAIMLQIAQFQSGQDISVDADQFTYKLNPETCRYEKSKI
jgi:hypothetical protein